MRQDEDPSEVGQRPDPRRRTSGNAPQHPRSGQADRVPRAPLPDQDARRPAPRPRPGVTASTGQLPMARTRQTTAGLGDTAPIPIIRQTPPGPAAPRPGVRQPEGQRPTGQPPVRSRLRTPPPGMTPSAGTPPTPHGLPPLPRSLREPVWPATRPLPTQPPAPPQVSLAPAVPARRPATRPITQAFSTLAPPPRPPEPTDFAAAPTRPRRRRGPKAVLAVLAVSALAAVWVLPAIAGHTTAGASDVRSTDDDVQHLQVGDTVEGGAVSTDAITGSAAVAAAGGTSSAGWMRPIAHAKLGDPFGPRPVQPVAGVSLFHRGQDLIASCGTPIRAAASGTVTAATWWGTYGNWILVDTGNGVAVGYAHESRIAVSVGQRVDEGQVIGYVGETGAATGCHLHLEVHLHGVAVNPVPFFTAKHIPLAG